MDPCGTPHVILPVSDVLLFTDTTWVLLSKYDSINHLKLWPQRDICKSRVLEIKSDQQGRKPPKINHNCSHNFAFIQSF